MAQDPLSILCIEPRFPGRLGAVADWLVRRRGYRCLFCCTAADERDLWPAATGKGLDVVQYNLGGVARETAVTWSRVLERGLCYSYGCWEMLDARRPRGIDLVLGRSAGLGSTLFVPTFQPGIPIVNLFDYYYHPHANDLVEETGADLPATYIHWRQAANAIDLLDLENGVHPWTPTRWQRDLYPPEYQADFRVQFDGVDTRLFHRPPGPRNAPVEIGGRTLPPDVRLVTFAATGLDRLRGFDRFWELAQRLLRERTDVVCAVVGKPRVLRGLDVQFFGQDYRAHMQTQSPPVDASRIWFFDLLKPAELARLLAASDLHVYPARPYPISRSLVEALAAGCVVLAADTAPVRELLTQGTNALLIAPTEPDEWQRLALAVLRDRAAYRPLAEAGTALVSERYSREVALPALASWFGELVEQASRER